MLREVINKHIKPRIAPFQITTTASGATLDIGYGDFTVTRTGAGAGVLTAKQGFSRNSIFIVSNNTATGGYAAPVFTTGQTRSFSYSILDESGAATEGSCEGFVFGWDNTDLSITKSQRVAATQGAPRVIWGMVNGTTGVMTAGTKDFSVTRTAAGVYSLVFTRAFSQTPVVVVNGANNISTTVANRGKVTSKTAAGCIVTMAPESATPTDGDFFIIVLGSDSRSDSARGRMPLQNSQRLPRIVAGQITVATGTPTITIGGATGGADLISVVDSGTGNFGFSVATPFKRQPGIFFSTTTQSVECSDPGAFPGTPQIFFRTKAANGNDTDVNGVTSIFLIGSDDASEY